MADSPCPEFDCCECGRHIIVVVGPTTDPLCASCLFQPGWFKDPRLRTILDPEQDGRDPADMEGLPA